MALDVGDRRIGVALSDPTGTIATPLLTLQRSAERKDLETLSRLAQEHAVQRIVIGLPTTLRGELGPQAQRTMRFGERLARVATVPIVYWDERYSTTEAEQIARSRGRGRRARKPVDEVAAAVILRSYLDSLPSGGC